MGDRVVPAPNRACGRCHVCSRGFPYYLYRAVENYGNSLTASRSPHLFGGWSDFLYLNTAAECEAVAEVRERSAGEGVDVVVNATGFPGSFAQAVDMVRDGGLVIEVGAFVDMGDEPFNPAVLCGRNLTLLGIGGEDLAVYEGTLALLARHQGSIAFADMISHRFGVDAAPEAMRIALDPDASAKVLIVPASR